MAVETLSESALAEIEARANAATRAPWKQSALAGLYIVADAPIYQIVATVGEYNSDGSVHLEFDNAPANLDFVLHARTDITALCQSLRAAWAKSETARKAMKDLVQLWDDNNPDDLCGCLGASDDCKYPPPCELCIARMVVEGKDPNDEY